MNYKLDKHSEWFCVPFLNQNQVTRIKDTGVVHLTENI